MEQGFFATGEGRIRYFEQITNQATRYYSYYQRIIDHAHFIGLVREEVDNEQIG